MKHTENHTLTSARGRARTHKNCWWKHESNLLAAMARALAQGGNRIWWLKKECACYIPELHTTKRKFKYNTKKDTQNNSYLG